MFLVKIDDNAIKNAKLLLSQIPHGAETAMSRAINRTVQGARTQIVRVVKERYTLPATDIRQTLSVVKSDKKTLTGEIKSRGTQLNASRFMHKPHGDTTGKKRRQVFVSFTKGNRFSVDRGFVWQGRIYKREGVKRLPFKALQGPSVPQMIGNKENIEKIEQSMTETFNKRIMHEIDVSLKGYGK